MRTFLAVALAYSLIAAGAVLITIGYTSARPGGPYPNVRHVSTTPNPGPWIQRYAALVTMAAHNAHESERH